MQIYRIKSLILNNKKVIENYFFMTVLQILNSLFYLLIYPFLIRTLGADSYGLYVFAMSIVTYFISFVSFGFDLPGAKIVSQNQNDKVIISNALSSVFTSKLYLTLISIAVIAVIILFFPIVKTNWIIISICSIQIFSNLLIPQWLYQGIQKMRELTMVQLLFKTLSLPFIFFMVKSGSDLWKFALILSLSSLMSGLVVIILLYIKHDFKIKIIEFNKIKNWVADALPFFWSSIMNTIKQQSTIVVIGSFFTMKDVALYDLANKIFTVPAILTANINGSLFPKIMLNNSQSSIKKIISGEFLLGITVIIFFILFGKTIIFFMGGADMSSAYILLVLLGFNILTPLLVSSFINFLFVPKNMYKSVFYNQFFSFITFFISVIFLLYFEKDVIVIAIAMLISGFVEIAYCGYLIKKNKLLI